MRVIVVGLLVILLAASWLKLRAPDVPYETLEAKYTDDTSHFVDLEGGLHVHYRDVGNPNLPLLVLLHGFGDSLATWTGWALQLKGEFRIVCLDFPGHGLTRAPPGYRLSGNGLADFVDAFAGKLELPPFAVAGNSMGGAVAWQMAVRHPYRVNALILVDAAGWPPDGPPPPVPVAFKILQYPIGRAVLRNIDYRPLIDSTLKADVFDRSLITPQLVDRFAELQRAPGHRSILTQVNISAMSQASAIVLSAIAVPTLILHGENDVLIDPSSARKFAAAIAGAKLIIYPHVGHLPQIEIPQRSAADVAAFLLAQHLVHD
jgi:pimeloyl-ACP methyl ester carboxylesterase